jgi:hypothetical protein
MMTRFPWFPRGIRSLIFVILLAAFALPMPAAATAQKSGWTSKYTIEYSGTNICIGEFEGTLTIKSSVKEVIDARGGRHFRGHNVIKQDVIGEDGVRYIGNAVSHTLTNVNSSGNWTQTLNYRSILVGQGTGRQVESVLLIHTTGNSNGILTANVTKSSYECKRW